MASAQARLSVPCSRRAAAHPLRTRSIRQRGSSFVELSLIFLPFMALMLAILDFSMPIFLRSVFMNAVREGCRYGITHQLIYNGTTYTTQTNAIKAVVQANSLGFLSGTAGANMIYVRYYASATPFGQLTGTGANAGGNIVEVSVSGYNWIWIAPLSPVMSGTDPRSHNPLAISAISADRLEPMAGGVALPTP